MGEPASWLQYSLVGLLAGLVGAAELFTRYRDSPRQLLRLLAFHAYWFGNAGLACLALLALHTQQVSIGEPDSQHTWLGQCLLAAFGSLLLLRSAVAVVQIDGASQQVGPGAAISALLAFIEEIVKRSQARARAKAVGRLMPGLEWAAAVENLPSLCLSLMSKTSAAVVQEVFEGVEDHRQSMCDDATKLLMLGSTLIEFCGEHVLEGAIGALTEMNKR